MALDYSSQLLSTPHLQGIIALDLSFAFNDQLYAVLKKGDPRFLCGTDLST